MCYRVIYIFCVLLVHTHGIEPFTPCPQSASVYIVGDGRVVETLSHCFQKLVQL